MAYSPSNISPPHGVLPITCTWRSIRTVSTQCTHNAVPGGLSPQPPHGVPNKQQGNNPYPHTYQTMQAKTKTIPHKCPICQSPFPYQNMPSNVPCHNWFNPHTNPIVPYHFSNMPFHSIHFNEIPISHNIYHLCTKQTWELEYHSNEVIFMPKRTKQRKTAKQQNAQK